MVKKILFVGLGSIGCRHLQNIKNALPSAQIAALRSQKREINNEFSDLIDHEFYNIGDAKKFSPEIVFIANPTSLHVETALEFINDVYGMFIEKPVSDSVEKVQKLIEHDSKAIIHVACPLRFHPALKFIKNYFDGSHKILSIKIASGSYLPEWRPSQNYKETYCARKELGGGVSLDLIHEVDYMRWIFGDVKEGYFGSSKVSELEIETEDIAYGVWKLKNKAICEIHLDYFRKVPERYMEVVNNDGIIRVDLINSIVTIDNGLKEEKFQFDFDRNDMYRDEIDYFLNCLKEEKDSFNDLKFALNTLKYAIFMRDNSGNVIL